MTANADHLALDPWFMTRWLAGAPGSQGGQGAGYAGLVCLWLGWCATLATMAAANRPRAQEERCRVLFAEASPMPTSSHQDEERRRIAAWND